MRVGGAARQFIYEPRYIRGFSLKWLEPCARRLKPSPLVRGLGVFTYSLIPMTTDEDDTTRRQLAEADGLDVGGAPAVLDGGFELANDLLARVARRQWSFSLSMYSAEGDKIIDAFLRRSESGGDSKG